MNPPKKLNKEFNKTKSMCHSLINELTIIILIIDFSPKAYLLLFLTSIPYYELLVEEIST